MTELVCLLSKTFDEENKWEISYILPADHELTQRWVEDWRREGVEDRHSTRPYKEGDIAMTNGNQIMLGLQILFKYDRNLEFSESHDEVFAGGKDMTYEEMVEVMSEEDLKEMKRLGWDESDYESWRFFT